VDIVISPAYIELGEVLRTLESMDEIINEGEGILISLHDGIKGSVVLDKVKFTILLLMKKTGALSGNFNCQM
jgi:hypothetical protein